MLPALPAGFSRTWRRRFYLLEPLHSPFPLSPSPLSFAWLLWLDSKLSAKQDGSPITAAAVLSSKRGLF